MIVATGKLVTFALYVVPNIHRLRKNPLVRAAGYCMLFTLGVVMRATRNWFLLLLYAQNGKVWGPGALWFLDFGGALAGIVGGLGAIAYFSPERLGPWPWRITAAVTILFVLAVHLIPT